MNNHAEKKSDLDTTTWSNVSEKKKLCKSTIFFIVSLISGCVPILAVCIAFYRFDDNDSIIEYIIMLAYNVGGGAFIISGIYAIVCALRTKEAKKISGIVKISTFLICAFLLIHFNVKFLSLFYKYQSAGNQGRQFIMAIGDEIMEYANNNNYHLPPAENWSDLLVHLDNDIYEDTFMVAGYFENNFAFNKYISGKKVDGLPHNIVVIFEADGNYNLSGGSELIREKRAKDKYFLRKKDIFIYVYFKDGTIAKYRIFDNAISIYDRNSQEFSPYTQKSPYLPLQWALDGMDHQEQQDKRY